MNNAALVNKLNKSSSPPPKPKTSAAKTAAIREYILWIFSILLSIGALGLVPLAVRISGGTIDVLSSIFFESELFFIGITAGISVLLEYDTKKIPDLIMWLLNISFIILGVAIYSLSSAHEYTSLIQELTTKKTQEEAIIAYNNISSGGIGCTIYLIITIVLGSFKYIRKIKKTK